jgi:hypothetical protein
MFPQKIAELVEFTLENKDSPPQKKNSNFLVPKKKEQFLVPKNPWMQLWKVLEEQPLHT